MSDHPHEHDAEDSPQDGADPLNPDWPDPGLDPATPPGGDEPKPLPAPGQNAEPDQEAEPDRAQPGQTLSGGDPTSTPIETGSGGEADSSEADSGLD